MGAEYQVVIEHRSEADFHAAFKLDLLQVETEAVLLSPFLDSDRACGYYALFADSVRRGARFLVFTRPEQQFAGESREEHARVIASLRAAGVEVRERRGMHEKVAILDRSILWHGSLNILSHGKSSESMLRIAAPDFAAMMLAELGLEDLDRPGPEAEWVAREHLVAAVAESAAEPPAGSPADPSPGSAVPALGPCPRCNGPMLVKRGAFTRVACADGACGFEFDRRLSAWLMRAGTRRSTD